MAGAALAQQSGKIRGLVKNAGSKETIPFVNVVAFQNGIQKKGTTTDFDGAFILSGLKPGKYDVKFTCLGFAPKQVNGINVAPGASVKVNMNLQSTDEEIEVVEVVIHVEPLIRDGGTSGGAIAGDDLKKMGTRSVNDAVNLVGGTVSADDGQTPSIKGTRASGTAIYINGVKQIGSANLPTSAYERVDVITGGVPAQFGDVVGGIVNITTKGASSKFFGGFEYETGRPFDQWNWDIAQLSVSGPLIQDTARDEKGNVIKDGEGNPLKDTKLGYFAAIQYTGSKDPRPSPIGITQVRDDVLADLLEFPLEPTANGYSFKAQNLTADDFVSSKVRPNVAANNVAFNGALDYQPNESTIISLGGSYTYDRRNGYTGLGESSYIYRYSLLNYNSNPLYRNNNYNIYARLRKSLDDGKQSDDSTTSAITNAYYQVQVDYSRSLTSTMDPNHRENVFNYGHIGQLTTNYESRTVGDDGFSNAGDYSQAMSMDGTNTVEEAGVYYTDLGNGMAQLVQYDGDTTFDNLYQVSLQDANAGVYMQDDITAYGVDYTPSAYNPYASNVLSHYFSLEDAIGFDVSNTQLLEQRGLYTNGQRSPFIAGLWYAPGRAYGGYGLNDNSQIRVSALASAEVNKKHQLTFGFEYEQRDQRSYNVNALGLWGLARSQVNSAFTNQDQSINWDYTSPIDSEVVAGKKYYSFDKIVDPSTQQAFDRNLRANLGIDDQTFIDFDAIDPENFSIDMFDANDLWQFNGGLVDYLGYDYTGKRLKNNSIAFEDYFLDSVNRPQTGFNPIYAAFFLEDRFEIEDLVIRFGVRVDRYDANQRVLKDQFSTVDLSLVGETNMAQFSDGEGGNFVTPGVVQDDWAVYVDQTADNYDPSKANQGDYTVLGFRDGQNWYDADGNSVPNPTFFNDGSSVLYPWYQFVSTLDETERGLYEDNNITLDAFEDYKPQLNVMPRLSFSFPISQEAGFYAHYDVLTQRPYAGNIITPSDYFFLRQRQFLNNANLRPVKKINYQLGFQQKLTDYSALTLEAFYNETRDEIAFTRINNAFPNAYSTFKNLDFGTSKGLVVSFDLRRKKNFRASIAYTLQFAEGTGSSSSTAQALIQANFDNLKVPFPLAFDQRHALKTNMDYRFGKVYPKVKGGDDDEEAEEEATGADGEGNGPAQDKLAWWSNMGANLTLIAGSGTPYSKNASTQSEVLLGVAAQSKLSGSPNGSRLPWNFRATLRVDKDIRIRKAQDASEGVEKKEDKYINVYIFAQNLFNNKNILGVYRNTGQPDDDGYLITAPDLNQSEIDLYNVALANPSNISLPRRVRIGVQYSF